jgi:tRNA A-37 threonylcarbamoyl transferase component Bud32
LKLGGGSRQSPISSISHETFDGSRFLPGQVLTSRYRVIDMIGRGGMGEVYRAEDLTLKQTVALKFLPESLIDDAPALERIRNEVSIARQIAHPYVCRVYDIGEAEGQHFLCMEFIKGEELASVLKRFGRLPSDKASDIARQICAGLAAAHKQGVIHRDLKPANVMIDGEGNAKITDFGLAAVAEQLSADEIRSGTPAYMSPEQLAGEPLTTRSDIYSLGLVLYEIFTGKRAYDAESLPELLKLRSSDTSVTSPSSHVSNLDPVVERVILRCLEKSPEDRPESAIAVAAALPGGDPLAAALAMGETPSPEMVAAAPKVGSLRPAIAAALLVAAVVAVGFVIWASGKTALFRLAPLTNSPDVLRVKARELTRSFGYKDGIDSADELRQQSDFPRYLKETDPSPERWDRMMTMHPSAYVFYLRQSPEYLVPWKLSPVSRFDPPITVPGMTRTGVDMDGKLLEFVAIPPQLDREPRQTVKFDWNILFNAAGLDPARFNAAEPEWLPDGNSDERAAWTGFAPRAAEIPIRVEAATYNGRPVFFSIIYPWDSPYRQAEGADNPGQSKAPLYIFLGVLLSFMLGTLMLARRNYRLGLGDYKGALRLALVVASIFLFNWAMRVHHVADFQGEVDGFFKGLSAALLYGVVVYAAYIALEPFVRRRWPGRIISWNRLIAGDLRDPLIGRDVLFGTILGIASCVVTLLWTLAPTVLGRPSYEPARIAPDALMSFRGALGDVSITIFGSLMNSLILTFALTLLVMVVRRDGIVAAIAWLLITAVSALVGGEHFGIDILFAALNAALVIFCATRLGLLATAVFFTAHGLVTFAPLTTDLSAWYAANALPHYAVIAFLLIYGYRTATVGKSLFSGRLLPE